MGLPDILWLDLMSREKQKLLVEKPGLTKDTVVLFGDAIFSIAITLLVLDIRLPELPAGMGNINPVFIDSLVQTLPKFLGFAISFFVIALYWRGYHRMTAYLKRFDGTMLLMNIVFLFLIVFMPFPTSLVGDYGVSSYVVVFYQVIMALTSIVMAAMWYYAVRGRRLIDPGLDGRLIGITMARNLIPAVVFLGTIPLAFVGPGVAQISWLAMMPLIYLAKRYYGVVDAIFYE
jgi:TMEM175 potassium channel family protein